jgi:flagellin
MRINHNIAALNTYRQLNTASHAQAKSMEKLSSGLRINRAGDDAAGLAISEKMRAQIRGLDQAARNSQDAISMIQTAEGAASSIHDMLQRGRELAVQAANDTLTFKDREQLDLELEQIKDQINKVANDTEFNTIKMLNNGALEHADLIPTIQDRLQYWVDDALTTISENMGLSPSFTTGKDMTVEFYEDTSAKTAASMGTIDGSSLNLRINLSKVAEVYDSGDYGWGQIDALIAHEVVHGLQFTELSASLTGDIDTWFMEGMATALQGGVPFLNNLSSNDAASINSSWNGDYGSAYAAVMTLHEITDGGLKAIIDELKTGISLDQAFANTTQSGAGELTTGVSNFTNVADYVSWFNSSADVDLYLNNSTDFTNPLGTIGLIQGEIRSSVSSWSDVIVNDTVLDNGNVFNFIFKDTGSKEQENYSFHIGANEGQNLVMSGVNLTTAGIGITGVKLTSQYDADQAITTINNAIEKVSGIRSKFGALQNRLEHTISNLQNSTENLTASESRIRDIDMASEMMNQTKNSILSQAAQAMLAQANQQPQGVLQLLR